MTDQTAREALLALAAELDLEARKASNGQAMGTEGRFASTALQDAANLARARAQDAGARSIDRTVAATLFALAEALEDRSIGRPEFAERNTALAEGAELARQWATAAMVRAKEAQPPVSEEEAAEWRRDALSASEAAMRAEVRASRDLEWDELAKAALAAAEPLIRADERERVKLSFGLILAKHKPVQGEWGASCHSCWTKGGSRAAWPCDVFLDLSDLLVMEPGEQP